MGQLDALLRELASEGRRESTGSFGMDDERAKALLAQFQLVDPYLYVVELLQASALMDASRVDVRCDADELWFRWDGASWTKEELEEMWSTALGSGPRPRALWHVAVAATALIKTDPATLRLTSRGEHGSFRVDLLSGEHAEVEVVGTASTTTHELYVRERFRMEHVREFLEKFSEPLPEVVLLEKHARYAETPIFVQGARVSLGMRAIEGAPTHTFERDGVRGTLSASLVGREVTVHLLQHGTLITTLRLPTEHAPLVAVIEDNALRRDLSLGAFVRDERWDWLFEEVLPGEVRQALFEVTRTLGPTWPWWVRPLYTALIRERNQASGVAPLHSAELKLLGELKRAPMFECINPGGLEGRAPGDALSLVEVREAMEGEGVLRVGRGWPRRDGLVLKYMLEVRDLARFMGVECSIRLHD